MAREEIIITGYSSRAIRDMTEIFASMNRGGAAQGGGGGSSNPGGGAQTENTDAIEENTDAVRQETKTFEKLQTATFELGKSFSRVKNIASSLNPLLDEFKSGVKGGVEAVDGFSGYAGRFQEAYVELGVSIVELHEFNTMARAASINMGGLDAWTGKLTEKQKQYYAMTGDATAAMKFQVDTQNMLIQSGAKASDLYGDFGTNLDKTNLDLLKMGVSLDESAKHLEEVSSDESTRQRLMSATSEKQRKQILLEMQGRFKNLKMMGMSTEQAKAASKALEALSGKGPLDRFKMAAKAQAGLSAMGVENAAEVANIIRKGDRATEAEREVVRKAMGEVQEKAAESRMGGTGGEFFADTIMEKTGLNDLPKIFSEKLGEGAKIAQAQLDATKVLGTDTPMATNIAFMADKLGKFLSSSWLASIPSILGDLGSGVLSLFMAFGKGDKLLGFLGNIGPSIKGAMSGFFGKGGTMSKAFGSLKKLIPSSIGGPSAGKNAGNMLKMAAGAGKMLLGGAAAAAAAYGVSQAMMAYKTGESDVAKKVQEVIGDDAWIKFGDFLGKTVDSVSSLWNEDDAARIETQKKILKEKMDLIKKSQEKEKTDELNSKALVSLNGVLTGLVQQLATANDNQKTAITTQIAASERSIEVLEASLGMQKGIANNTDKKFKTKGNEGSEISA